MSDNPTYEELEHRILELQTQLSSQRDLANSLLSFKSYVEEATDIISLIDETGKILYNNPATESLLGFKPREGIGKLAFDFIHHDDHQIVRQALEEIIEKPDTIQSVEFRYRLQDGSWRIFESKAVNKLADPNVNGIVVFSRDITDRVEAETAMQESEERFRSITLAAQDAIIVMEGDRGITLWNQAAERIFQYTNEEVLGRNPHEFLASPADLERFREAYPQFQKSGEGAAIGDTLELLAIRKDGEYVPIGLSLSALQRKGQWYAVAIIRDISDRKKAEHDLKKAMNAADEANHAKSVFLANMSHEIRTPMNSVLGFTELMLNHELDPKIREYTEIIHESGRHLMSLINEILDMSKLEAGKMEYEPTEFDLHSDIKNLYHMLRVRADEKGLDLFVEQSGNVPRYIRTDRKKFGQIMINLVGNAIKFTVEGGVSVRYKTIDNMLNVEVEDSGVGISEDEIGFIFDPFHQAEGGRIAREGTGLGLAISKSNVELLGGEIEVKSRVDSGTLFKFYIPFEEVSESEVTNYIRNAKKIVQLKPNQKSKRILIADDQLYNRKLVTALLDKVGFSYIEAENGQEAVELWEQSRPDMVIMDLRMPVMTGYEATAQIRILEDKLDTHTPILALSASSYDDNKERIYKAGCDYYMRKPFRESELLEFIGEKLNVEYEYDDTSEPVSDADKAAIKYDPSLIDSDIRTKIIDAATAGDGDTILEICEKIKADTMPISKLVKDFQYKKIISLLEQT